MGIVNGLCQLVKSFQLRFGSVVKVTRVGIYSWSSVVTPVSPGCWEKLTRMSERCNLKTLTAALCCFYHKNSVITAKVREKWCMKTCDGIDSPCYVICWFLVKHVFKCTCFLCMLASCSLHAGCCHACISAVPYFSACVFMWMFQFKK